MGILFYLGGLWGTPPDGANSAAACRQPARAAGPMLALLLAVSTSLLLPSLHRQWLPASGAIAHWPQRSLQLLGERLRGSDWQPAYHGADDKWQRRHNDTGVELFLAYYSHRAEGELIAWDNKIYREDAWGLVASQPVQATLDGHDIRMRELLLSSAQGKRRILWYSYQVAGHFETRAFVSKLRQALARLLGQAGDGFVLAVSLPYQDDPAAARRQLQAYLDSQGKQLLALKQPVAEVSG